MIYAAVPQMHRTRRGLATCPVLPSALRWQNDTEYNALVGTHLSRSADMSAPIGRDHVVDLVVGNRRPNTVHFNFVVVANDATLGRPTIHQIAAQTSVVSSELRVEALMPFIVARPVVSLLRRSVHTKKQGSRTAECAQQFPPSDGDCHAPLPCEVRRGKNTTPRACCLTARHPARAGRTPRHCGAPASLRLGAVRRCVGARFSLRATRPAQQRQANLRARMQDLASITGQGGEAAP